MIQRKRQSIIVKERFSLASMVLFWDGNVSGKNIELRGVSGAITANHAGKPNTECSRLCLPLIIPINNCQQQKKRKGFLYLYEPWPRNNDIHAGWDAHNLSKHHCELQILWAIFANPLPQLYSLRQTYWHRYCAAPSCNQVPSLWKRTHLSSAEYIRYKLEMEHKRFRLFLSHKNSITYKREAGPAWFNLCSCWIVSFILHIHCSCHNFLPRVS